MRNREPIAEVLREWLPSFGLVLEIASGTGEHAVYFAGRFPELEWQPSDVSEDALASISAWRNEAALPNLREPLRLDAGGEWPIVAADAILSINMAHIAPWTATLGLLDRAAAILPEGAPLIFYGPWFSDDVTTAASNLDFDAQLRSRDPEWGIRKVEDVAAEADQKRFRLVELRSMPANNFMLLLRKMSGCR